MFHASRREYDSPPYYETAQVCINGHIITDTYNRSTELRKEFCPKCGGPTIFQCPSCSKNIQGDYVVPGVVVIGSGVGKPPAFCYACGKPFPWTESSLDAARQITLEAEELSDQKEKLTESLPDLVADSPRTQVAISRWKKALDKVGPQLGGLIREVLVDVVTESVKKTLFP